MDVQINGLAVLLAALSTMVVGSIWYAQSVFGKVWMELVHLDQRKKELKIGKKDEGKAAGKAIGITLVVSLVTAYVLAHVTFLANHFFQHSFMQDALATAFWMWLGFVATRFITHDAFEMRPVKLTLMNVSHELVTFMVMGLIIGWLKP